MRYRILLLAGLSCSGLFFSCKKDAEPLEESPFFDFFNNASIAIDTVEQSADTWEYGFVFTPLKSGKINRFAVKVPATGDFRVTLWDLSGPVPSVLKTQTVSLSDVHESSTGEPTNIALQKDVKYGITVQSNAFFRITNPGNAPFLFPKTFGNIRVESFNEGINNSAAAVFPTTTNDTRVAPCVNVIFIAD